jgi:hypothetical protein
MRGRADVALWVRCGDGAVQAGLAAVAPLVVLNLALLAGLVA